MEKEIEQNGKGSGILQLKVIPGFDYRTMNDKIKKVSAFFFFRDGSGIVCQKKLFGPFILLDKTELRKSAFSVLIDNSVSILKTNPDWNPKGRYAPKAF